MKILVALRREEQKLERQVIKVQAALAGLRTAMQVLTGRKITRPKRKRAISAEARRRMSLAQRKRWAKIRSAK